MTLHFLIDEEDQDSRLDVFLAEQDDPPLTRSQVKRAIDAKQVLLNGQPAAKAGVRLRTGDHIEWDYQPPPTPDLTPQHIPLDILYEDDDIAVVDKPPDLLVHPSPGHPDHTLVNALLYHFEQLAGADHRLRPGIVHRLDKDTSGALAITKSDRAMRHLSGLFRTHDIERAYHALVFDQGLPDQGTFSTLHGRDPRHRIRFTGRVSRGRTAVTHYRVLQRFPDAQAALVECRLETGRTHQIRVHLSEAQCPILGDQLYGGKAAANARIIGRQALHARTLGFTLPSAPDAEPLLCTAPYPDDFARALDALRAGKRWR